jgi:hypothetical protein
MYRASKAVTLAAKTGDPLPRVDFMQDMYAMGNEFLKGTVVMLAGMPAAMKSTFALNLVHKMGVPCLYFSADSDAATQLSRLAASILQEEHRSIRKALDGPGQGYYRSALEETKVQFAFDSQPDAYDIENEISAWVELYDEYPEIIVIDNLRNIFVGESSNEHGGYKMIQQKLIDIARETGACVITMHHMKEGGGRKATDPSPRSAVDGMVNQLPNQIISVARDGDEFRGCVVKDREAPDHAEAEPEHWFRLRVDAPRATFYHKQSMQEAVRFIEENWTPTSVLERTPS